MAERGPFFDRFLMRSKDFIIISSSIVAIANWYFKRSDAYERRWRVIEDRLLSIESVVMGASAEPRRQ